MRGFPYHSKVWKAKVATPSGAITLQLLCIVNRDEIASIALILQLSLYPE